MNSRDQSDSPVIITHPDKIYFPAAGFTKGEMIQYYSKVAPFMLPHLRRRPMTLIRYPEGVTGHRFYSKNAPSFTPKWVATHPVPRRSRSGTIDYVMIDDERTLMWCANLGSIEFHPFLHRVPAIDRPTHLVFDLDPGEGADILSCVAVAFLVRELMAQLGLEIMAKVTGSKGLQLAVPLNTRADYAATGAFSKAVAELLQQRHPDLVISRMDKASRRDRVFIDWSQNSVSKTTVAVYSMRGKRDQPFISMPVSWEELTRAKKTGRPDRLFFSPGEALTRLEKTGDLFAPVLTLKQTLPKKFGRPDTRSVTPAKRVARSKKQPRRTRSAKRASVPA